MLVSLLCTDRIAVKPMCGVHHLAFGVGVGVRVAAMKAKCNSLLPQLPDEMEEMETQTAGVKPLEGKALAAAAVSAVPEAPSQLPEVEAYACLLALVHLTDLKQWEAVSAYTSSSEAMVLTRLSLSRHVCPCNCESCLGARHGRKEV